MNRLSHEKSPYLLQHAHNPVDWHAWGEEAFAKARAENKPIFLSIGYSTCHWCHVMERESFENEKIAELLNHGYVSIKVDREERPDVDRIYMTFVQATTGSGGWPMSVFLTPELKPFYGGTYFPPENRYGNPGFAAVLTQIASAWESDRAKIDESARDVVEQLKKSAAVEGHAGGGRVDAAILEGGFSVFRRTFDTRLGGFGGAPKFPRPSVHNFLLRYYARTKTQEALDMVLQTLRAMAKGGMNDQLGGGFHRYSVDDRWFVSHFEKMLYDQGQLATSYLEAFQITRDQQYADTARRILDYVLRDMTDAGGAFYSAEDADSVIDPSHPDEKGEGAFYIWAADEIRALVPNASDVMRRFGARDGGNVDYDPHGEFTGKNILYLADESVDVGDAPGILLAARGKRPRPHLDDKILTAWNGLMISAFALAGAVLEEPRYAEAARRATAFILDRMYIDGVLLRRYRAGDAAIPAFLDDYAFFVQALLDLYEAQFDIRHLNLAVELTVRMRERFEDAEHGGFFSSPADDQNLVMRVKDDYDGAEPSGNSAALLNLLRLTQMTNRDDFRQSASRALAAFERRLSLAPSALPQMLAACEFLLSHPRQVIVVGDSGAADTNELLRTLHAHFLPNQIALLIDSEETRALLSRHIPEAASMQKVDKCAAAYVCRDYACQLPVTEAAQLAELLQ
ncbi:MAG TPA: thioredoxin domain-containing protein [Bryobacteraceae bacterium]|nr:thioredoxin domain-containing protein [Bryobacteraceae bacterium]